MRISRILIVIFVLTPLYLVAVLAILIVGTIRAIVRTFILRSIELCYRLLLRRLDRIPDGELTIIDKTFVFVMQARYRIGRSAGLSNSPRRDDAKA